MFTVHKPPFITIRLAIVVAMTVLAGALAFSALAQPDENTGLLDASDQAKLTAERSGLGSEAVAPEVAAGQIFGYAMGVIGIVFFIVIVIAAWQWLTAQGNEERITKAKNTIRNSVIAVVILFGAYAIAAFVLDRVIDAVT